MIYIPRFVECGKNLRCIYTPIVHLLYFSDPNVNRPIAHQELKLYGVLTSESLVGMSREFIHTSE